MDSLFGVLARWEASRVSNSSGREEQSLRFHQTVMNSSSKGVTSAVHLVNEHIDDFTQVAECPVINVVVGVQNDGHLVVVHFHRIFAQKIQNCISGAPNYLWVPSVKCLLLESVDNANEDSCKLLSLLGSEVLGHLDVVAEVTQVITVVPLLGALNCVALDVSFVKKNDVRDAQVLVRADLFDHLEDRGVPVFILSLLI